MPCLKDDMYSLTGRELDEKIYMVTKGDKIPLPAFLKLSN